MLFPWFRAACPVDPDTAAYVEGQMSWLAGEFGLDRLLRSRMILPTEEFFPDSFDGSGPHARRLMARVCGYLDVDPATVEFVFSQDGLAGDASGTPGQTIVTVEAARMADPISLAASTAHELCCRRLFGNKGGQRLTEDQRAVAELAAVFLGMGIFTANSILVGGNYRVGHWEGWTLTRQGCLTAAPLAYALALFAWLRKEGRPEWARYLRLDVGSPFWKALKYLKRGGHHALPEVPQSYLMLPNRLRRNKETESTAEDDEADPTDEAQQAEMTDTAEDTPSNRPAFDRDTVDEWFTQAVCLMQEEKWDEAVSLLSRVIEASPHDGEAYQQRALALGIMERWQEAIPDAEAAVRYLPDDSESYRVRAAAYVQAHRWREAVADYTRYLEEEDVAAADGSRLSKAYYWRGVAQEGEANTKAALADFTKAIQLWPQWPAPYEARAALYQRLGHESKAQADREEAQRRDALAEKVETAPGHWTQSAPPAGL